MKVFVSIFLSALIFGCSSSQGDHNTAQDVEVKYSYVHGDEATSKAKLAVKGMACEIMCGGLIKKSLKNLDGVNNAAVSFNPDDKSGLAEVDFDSKQITEKELIAAIEKLNDGQYKVNSVEIVVTETSFEEIKEEEGSLKKAEEQVLDKKIALPALPNIFEVINRALLR